MSCLLIWGNISSSLAQSYKKELKQHRKEYKQHFLTDARSPLDKKGIKDLRFFPANESYRVRATFSPAVDAKPFNMTTYSGKTQKYVVHGTIQFQLIDTTLSLTIYRSLRLAALPQYRDYLFLPFKDLTNGELTYGGGRYMDLRRGDIQEGEVIIDFNKAYNPWCAYSDGYNCPIPPRENVLAVAIEAGEKNFEGEKK